MYYNCYFLLIAFLLCQQFNFIYVKAETSESYLFSKSSLLKLKSALEKPVLTTWSYNDQYTEIADLLITPNETDKALLYDGQSSEWGVARQLLKALEGEDVNLYIFGESVSVGADLGKNSEKYIYHYALANWWNETIGKITNSFMLRRNIAVGGVGTSYFSKCWEEYVADNERFDMALWEFNINDFIDQKLEENIETFTRSIYKRYNATDLMFAIFYRNSWFKEDAMEKRSKIAKKTKKRVTKLGRKHKEILKKGYSDNSKDFIKEFTTFKSHDYEDVKNNNITNKWQNMSAKWHNKIGFRNDIAATTYNISGKYSKIAKKTQKRVKKLGRKHKEILKKGNSDNSKDFIKEFTTFKSHDYEDVKNNNITNKWQNMSAKWHNKIGFRNDIAVRTYNVSGKWKNMSHKWHDQMGVKIWHDQQGIIQDKKQLEGKDVNNHKRHDISENIVLSHAKRYNLSCFNIEAYLNSTNLPANQNDLFIKIHPSILAHAQMALSIISYYRRVMLTYINSWLDKNQPTYTISTISNLPPPIFIKSDNFDTLCWNAVITNKLDPSRLKHLIFDLAHNETKDYIKVLAPLPSIEKRTDNTGGYKTTETGGYLSVSFDVPLHEGVETCDVSVGLRYENKDSLTVVTLFDNSRNQIKSKVVDAIQKKDQLYIIFISSVKPGKHTLKLTSLKGGVLLSAILVC